MFAMPVLLGNVFQQFYNMADTMMVGRILGVDALAAMGATASVSGLVLGLNIGLAQGFAIPIAQYVGAGDMGKVRKAVAGTLMLGLIFVLGITIAALMTGIPILKLLGTPEEIMGMSVEYIFIIYGGLIITMMYNMAASILRSYGDSRTPLYFLILASLTNIVLDYVFLKTLRMGVGGAAIATLISQALSVVLCVLYIKEKTSFLIPGKEDFRWDREMLKAQLSLGISMGLMNSIGFDRLGHSAKRRQQAGVGDHRRTYCFPQGDRNVHAAADQHRRYRNNLCFTESGGREARPDPQRAALLHGDQLCVVDVLHPDFLLGDRLDPGAGGGREGDSGHRHRPAVF